MAEGLGLVHAHSFVGRNNLQRRQSLAGCLGALLISLVFSLPFTLQAQLRPVGAGGLGVIVEQSRAPALLGIGDSEIGGDGGFATAALAVNYQDSADPFHSRVFMVCLQSLLTVVSI